MIISVVTMRGAVDERFDHGGPGRGAEAEIVGSAGGLKPGVFRVISATMAGQAN
jgi:hypothetical protein